jgi:starch phosphorylase
VYSGNTFSQSINPDGSQNFEETDWQRMDQLSRLPNFIKLRLGDHNITVGCWRYDMVGLSGHVVPVYLLDTNVDDNPQWAKDITKNLYGGDASTRICQEIVLGIGGVKMLRELGYSTINTYHLNEGHCAFVPLALLPEHNWEDAPVRSQCVFTTHTPVPEGHDRFTYDHTNYWAGSYLPWHVRSLAGQDMFSLTDLALNLSHSHIAVSKKHALVSHHLFPSHNFTPITNGVHHRSWTWYVLQDLFDQYLPGWISNPELLLKAPDVIPDDALSQAHTKCKTELVNYVNHHLKNNLGRTPDELFDSQTMIISMARRPVAYKRPLLLYQDLERFIRIGVGKIQIIQCGKSHPSDDVSQGFVREIIKISQRLKTVLRIAYLENYSPKIARLLVSGSDVWLNTPRRPLEASGTSGMKAALNGVLNFSVLDGWWIEGYEMDSRSGFTIGPSDDSITPTNSDAEDANDLYTKLETEIIPMYYSHHTEWLNRMKHAIALGAHFNTHRVVSEYKRLGWES